MDELNNDMLMVFTQDGDVLEDTNVRQKYGYLVSDKYSLAIPMPGPPVSVYEWNRGDESPTKKMSAYIFDSEAPPPETDALLINKVLTNVRDDAKNGDWKPHKPMYRRTGAVLGAACLMVWGLFSYMLWDTYQTRSQFGLLEYQQAMRRQAVQQTIVQQPNYQQIYAEQGGKLAEADVAPTPTPEPTPTPQPIRIRK